MTAPLILSPQDTRRLAIIAQHLEAPRPNPSKADLLATIGRITCLQLDPINVVARTQLLVPFSRLGPYDPAHLDALLWEDRALFEYWAHAASIVLADDFPLFRPHMREREVAGGVWRQRVRDWLEANHAFRQALLGELAQRGPLFAEQIESRAAVAWPYPNSWGSGNDVGIMLEILWLRGYVTVTARQGNGYGLKKRWGLMEHQVGDRVHVPPADRHTLVRRAAERSLLALGPARGICTATCCPNWSASGATSGNHRPSSSPRSITSSPTATAPSCCSTSATALRSTPQPPSAAMATTSCPSSTASGSLAASIHEWIARPGGYSSMRCIGSQASSQTARRGRPRWKPLTL